MAEKEEEENLLVTPQEHALMCEKHYLMPIDITCEDCEDFICSACVKENHKDHNWQTIQTAAALKARGLLISLRKTEENYIHQIDQKIQRTSEQMEENKKKCDFELMMFQKNCNSIVVKLNEIKKKHEKTLRDSLKSKHYEVNKNKSVLGEKKRGILRCITAIRKNGSTMTDITLLRTHREMTKLLSTDDEDSKENYYFSMGYKTGEIHEAVLESLMGYIFNVEEITVTQTDSFKCGDEYIIFLKAINEDTCLLRHTELPYLEQVTKDGKTEKQFNVDVNDVCFTSDKETYVTAIGDKSVSRLSLLGLVSAVFSTDPFEPMGICLTMDGNLMLTLSDTESELYEINSRSRRLVRHVTLTGDVIREYEHKEDGQTRLFTYPRKIIQNGNTDICVINWTSISISELVLLSHSGSLKFVYHGQDQRKDFTATDVVCDTHFNIIVSELQNSKIHLVSPDGELLRYLLTENQVDHPFALSLKKSTLWIGGNKGLVKVFQYKT